MDILTHEPSNDKDVLNRLTRCKYDVRLCPVFVYVVLRASEATMTATKTTFTHQRTTPVVVKTNRTSKVPGTSS